MVWSTWSGKSSGPDMDWGSCVICDDYGGTSLKCPIDSKQNNGLGMYSNFLAQ